MRNFCCPILSNPTCARFLRRGPMFTCRFSAALILSLTVSVAFAQTTSAPHIPAQTARPSSVLATGGAPADEAKEPKLEHFDPNLVDKSLDPCSDFYKYSCSKWLTANPIPCRPGLLEHGQRPGVVERKSAARNAGSGEQKRSQSQRRSAEDRRLLGRLHGRKRHRSRRPEAAATGTGPHCSSQVQERNHAGDRAPPSSVSGSLGAV